MSLEPLTAVSSVDGRYHAVSAELSAYFSEYALTRARIAVECEYLIALSETGGTGVRKFSGAEKDILRRIASL